MAVRYSGLGGKSDQARRFGIISFSIFLNQLYVAALHALTYVCCQGLFSNRPPSI